MRTKLFISVLLLLIAAVVCFACVGEDFNIAYADDILHFEIRTTDGSHWELWCDGWMKTQAIGQFVNRENPTDNEQPAVKFYNVIRGLLEHEDDEYELKFVLPSPTISFVDDIAQNPYTENADSNIIIDVPYTSLLSSASFFIEYKEKGADDDAYQSFPYNFDVRFGQNIPKGEYDLRVRVEEQNFKFTDEKLYDIIVYSSNTLQCEITDSDFPEKMLEDIKNQELADLEFEYGFTLQDIADYLSARSRYGTWTVNSSQNPSQKLNANTAKYTIYLDFQSRNTNYNKVEGIATGLVVNKRSLEVYIRSIEILQGKPLLSQEELFEYCSISTDMLAQGDTLESIGFKINTSGIDPAKVGDYQVVAEVSKSAATNYNVVTRSPDSMHISYGLYRVRPNFVEAISEDFRKIIIERADGFIGKTVEIEYFDSSILSIFKIDGYKPICSYGIVVKDENGETVEHLGELTITLEKRADDYAIAYFVDEEWHIVVLDESMKFTLPNEITGFIVLKPLASAYFKTVEWNNTLTALSILIVVLVTASWIVLVVYFAKRRFLND